MDQKNTEYLWLNLTKKALLHEMDPNEIELKIYVAKNDCRWYISKIIRMTSIDIDTLENYYNM